MTATALAPRSADPASESVLGYCARQSAFSTPGRHAALFDALPSDPAGIARAIQGLLIYEHVAEPFYGCPIDNERRAESHIRPVEKFIDTLLRLDSRPLSVTRRPEHRLVGICRHFMLLAIAIFRHHGIPARGRGGFGAYFNLPKYEDHWVCEYWKEDEGRWVLLDSQIDAVFTRNLSIQLDPVDVPRDQFLTSPDAWRKCRGGGLDTDLFGIEFAQLRGLWFIAASLVRDFATLNGCEILPWDVWGAQPAVDAELSADEIALFDGVAELTADPDANFDAMRRRFANDGALSLPHSVFNALRQRQEDVFED